jgi:molecular chaperone GrpE
MTEKEKNSDKNIEDETENEKNCENECACKNKNECEDKEEKSIPFSEFQQKRLTQVEKELKEYKEKYVRLLAESENTRKRLHKEKTETLKFAIENTICDFIPALDNFENALNHSKNSTEEVKNWATGFNMILSQFRDILHNHNIVAFHSEGNTFDPHFHEALEIVETSDHPDGMILEEYAKGYKSNQRTIRPARVKVAKEPAKEEEEKVDIDENADEKITNNKNSKE